MAGTPLGKSINGGQFRKNRMVKMVASSKSTSSKHGPGGNQNIVSGDFIYAKLPHMSQNSKPMKQISLEFTEAGFSG